MALNSIVKNAFRVSYEISPIILNGGIAENIPGGMLPIVAITESLGLSAQVLNGNINLDLGARFLPMAGSTLIEQEIPVYNQYNQVALANCTVKRPNVVNLSMIFPAQTGNGGYAAKIATMTALQLALDNHNQRGGTYTVLTPSYIYTGCLLRRLSDQSSFSERNLQVQYQWLFEFYQPIVLQSQFQAAFSTMLKKLSTGIKGDGIVTNRAA